MPGCSPHCPSCPLGTLSYLPAPQGSNSQGAPSHYLDQPATGSCKSMPSSPEVWPHESLIAQDKHWKGRPEGIPKGTATTVMALNASGGVQEAVSPARVSVSAASPQSPPGLPGTARRQQRGDWALYLSSHTLSVMRLSGDPGGIRYVDLERPRAWRGRDPKLHAARVPLLEAATPATKPALRPQPRWCRGRPRERLPPAQRSAPLLPRRTLRAPSTCWASLARVVTAP